MRPNFLLIGCSKAGTTSLHQWLGQHPEVFMCPIKEPGYFVFAGTSGRFPEIADEAFVTGWDEYERLFRGVSGESAVGESSTYYLDYASPTVVDRIHRDLPQVRLLAVLRHPVERAWSRYTMLRRDGRCEGQVFRERFREDLGRFREPLRPAGPAEHLIRSVADHLALFRKRFPAESLAVTCFDDLRTDPRGFLQEVFQFLGVAPTFQADTTVRRNTGGIYRSRVVEFVFNRPNPIRWAARKLLPARARISGRDRLAEKLVAPVLSLEPDLRAELTRHPVIQQEIGELEELSGRDLSGWRA